MKILGLLISFGLISVLVADDRNEYYNIIKNTNKQIEKAHNAAKIDEVMMHFAKSPTIPIDWRNYNTIEKMEIQRDAQKLIKDATKIEAPTEVEDLDGAKFNLSEHENIRKGYVTIDRIRSLIIKEMIKDQTTAEHIGYFEDRPFRCRLLAMHRILKNPLNIILEAKIIKVNDADICQLMDSKRNHIRYRRVSGVFWRDNPDNNKMDETLASELGLEEEV